MSLNNTFPGSATRFSDSAATPSTPLPIGSAASGLNPAQPIVGQLPVASFQRMFSFAARSNS
ncbi:hypothetical protein [Uliginosibacterium sp. H1]|uniref:hypothetical protein n=1 Tax=Uliginosibacterium sp. H1 TaxID=3114757 RepID=UPI002E17A40D|nr:hypothetical protein [Uliginosibacterium sp. H1]